MENLESMRSTIQQAIDGLHQLQISLNDSVNQVIDLIVNSEGRFIVTGVGKSALVAQKIVATMNSTGTASIYMHSGDALHGDLGMVQKQDIVLCISKSGNSNEIKTLIPTLKNSAKAVIGMTAELNSYLALNADYILHTPVKSEADLLNLAPTTSSTVQLVMGDALALALMALYNFKTEDFARVHPAGTLGKRLHLKLSDILDESLKPHVHEDSSLEEVILEISSKRMGATAVLNNTEELVGIITDGDLRRNLFKLKEDSQSIATQIMTKNPKSIPSHTLASEALDLMNKMKITQLLVTNGDQYVGIIHIHQLIKEGLHL